MPNIPSFGRLLNISTQLLLIYYKCVFKGKPLEYRKVLHFRNSEYIPSSPLSTGCGACWENWLI
nr:MAG TPA: Cerato-platanin-like protein [Caudoviricetes sp.]